MWFLAARLGASGARRCLARGFSVQAETAGRLLARHTGLELGPIKRRVDSSGDQGDDATTLAILLHADRRPQLGGTFFGPSLLVCDARHLEGESTTGLGEGDLGLLQHQHRRPSDVLQTPVWPSEGVTEQSAESVLGHWMSTHHEEVHRQGAAFLIGLWDLFKKSHGVWFSLKLRVSRKDGLSILSPFLEFDDYGRTRMPEEIRELFDARPQDQNTAQAERGGLFYIKLNNRGTVGSFGYGAGNAMATMDGIALAGGRPANFLDGGGGANRENARLALETLNRDPDVKSIFVNTFGGITQTDVVADGVIDAIRDNKMRQSVVVRVMGTGSEVAREKLRTSGLDNVQVEDDFKTAARLAVEASQHN